MARREPGPKRHRWLKLKEHWYVCLDCGTLKENRKQGGEWVQWFTRPYEGKPFASRFVPPCEVGPLTAQLLAQANEIANEGSVSA